MRLGASATVSQGVVVRSLHDSVELGNYSVVLENSVVVGTPIQPVRVDRRTVFGHRCQVIGAIVGDLCELATAQFFCLARGSATAVFWARAHSFHRARWCRTKPSSSVGQDASSGGLP